MLSTTLKVVPGESTFKLNMFTLMCGIFRFSTFSSRRTLVPECERTCATSGGEKCPVARATRKNILSCWKLITRRKSRYIDNRHVRLLLSLHFISFRGASQQCCWWWWRWRRWKHERGLFSLSHSLPCCSFSTHDGNASFRTCDRVQTLLLRQHESFRVADSGLIFSGFFALLLFIRILIARATSFFHVTYGEKAHFSIFFWSRAFFLSPPPSPIIARNFTHFFLLSFRSHILNWRDRKSLFAICLWFI